MCSSLASILATFSVDETIPYKVGVSLNKTYIGDMMRPTLSLVLGGMTCEVGDTLTLEEVWAEDGYPYYWEQVIILHLTSNGWVADKVEVFSDISSSSPTSTVRLRTRGLSASITEVKYAKSDRRWSRHGSMVYYKRTASRTLRRTSRAIIEEGMVGDDGR